MKCNAQSLGRVFDLILQQRGLRPHPPTTFNNMGAGPHLKSIKPTGAGQHLNTMGVARPNLDGAQYPKSGANAARHLKLTDGTASQVHGRRTASQSQARRSASYIIDHTWFWLQTRSQEYGVNKREADNRQAYGGEKKTEDGRRSYGVEQDGRQGLEIVMYQHTADAWLPFLISC